LRRWLAVALPAFFLAIQHGALPLIFEKNGFDSLGIAERHSGLFYPSDLAFDDHLVSFHRFIGRAAQHLAVRHVKT